MADTMISKYTETLEDLLENKKYGTASQDAVLTEILELFSKFPDFIFGDDIEFSMFDMFKERYDLKEIGAETEELFLHYLREKTRALVVEYVPRITMWLNNFNELFKFTVKLDLTDEQNYSDGSQNTYYLNPVSATTGVEKTIVVDEENKTTTTTFSGGNLKVQDIDTNDNNGQKSRKITRDVLQTVWGKTRADILSKIIELKSVYNECLNKFEILFLGVY